MLHGQGWLVHAEVQRDEAAAEFHVKVEEILCVPVTHMPGACKGDYWLDVTSTKEKPDGA